MDTGAGRARPEQHQPQHNRGPRQHSPSAAGRHVYSSISILFPRHFRSQGAAGARDRGGAGLSLTPVSAGSLLSPGFVPCQRGSVASHPFPLLLGPFWTVPRPEAASHGAHGLARAPQ